MLIDIGANLTHESFKGDLKSVLTRAKDSNVEKIIVTGTSVHSSREAQQLTQKHDSLHSTAGIHPHYASETSETAIADLEKILNLPQVVAVGETGLEFFRDYTARKVQIFSFEKHIELAIKFQLPMFLHERDAHEVFYDVLQTSRDKLNKLVVHCFTGNRKALFKYLDLDCYIGVTGWICDERRGKDLQKLVAAIPSNRLMIETDAPYLLPRTLKTKPKNRRCEPMHLNEICEQVATCTGKTKDFWALNTSRNAKSFFSLGKNK